MNRWMARLAPVLVLAGLAGTAWSSPTAFEVRVGGLYLNSKEVRDVYRIGLVVGADLTIPVWKGLSLWVGADYYSKKGKLTFTLEDTTLRVVPVFSGFKLQATSSSVRPYLALAAGCFLYKESNILGTVSGSKIGPLAQLGLLVKIKRAAWLDIHVRFTSVRYKNAEEPEPLTADIGGIQGGLGLAFRF
jgi:hypothetical protein